MTTDIATFAILGTIYLADKRESTEVFYNRVENSYEVFYDSRHSFDKGIMYPS